MRHFPDRRRTCIATASSRCPPCRRPSMRRCAEQARAAALEIAERLDYVGVLCIEFFVLDDGTPGGQRNGAASAQLRPLQHRRRRHQPVRAAGAGDGRPAAGRRPTCWRRRSCSTSSATPGSSRRQPARARLGRRAGAARRQAAPLRQGRSAARPQDGPRDRAGADTLPQARAQAAAIAPLIAQRLD